MPRVFAAIDLPPAHQRALVAQHRGVESARWERSPHITVAHFGNLPDDSVAELRGELASVEFSAFELRLGQIGFFGSDVMWVGVDFSPDLLALAQSLGRVRESFSDTPERHRFSPHVTLARLGEAGQEQVVSYVDGFDHSALCPFMVRAFSLLKSDNDGYSHIADFECEPAESAQPPSAI